MAVNKCSVLCIGKSFGNIDFFIGNEILPCNMTVLDLGVTIDKKLNFSMHVNNIVRVAHSRANLIVKCFVSNDPHSLIKAFITYVRPLVEYCSPVWSPHSVSLIDQLESVQRRFTKRLNGLKTLTYTDRLAKLNLASLELRRLHADLCLCFKIVHGHIALKCDDFFDINVNSVTRGHNLKLSVKCSSLNVRQHFFTNRVVAPWNSLASGVVNAVSVQSFKQMLKGQDLSCFVSSEH